MQRQDDYVSLPIKYDPKNPHIILIHKAELVKIVINLLSQKIEENLNVNYLQK
ncbi:hypothetical protein U27_05521 [Candidatus Vecturithrix granuli]|uniref:Uncharacterized protein n=1 Tax=Vecturithrix granuli TaxID=1499967 RepID=A0A081C1U2_VECG1|nr:hypothetical protein U27_05521 [Candidatus Vecturithrix granuli]